jgi:dTDP-4-amino-4,6-dideoxygalactose transaminase
MVVLEADRDRTRFIADLRAEGFECGPGSVAGHLGRHFESERALEVSARLHHQGLALPLYASLDLTSAERIGDRVLSLLSNAPVGTHG